MLNFSKHHAVAKLIKKAVLLLWDECTMLSKEALEIIDRSLRDLMENDLPFGGKLFVFTGDWAQCLPVAKNRYATVSATHLQSELWESVTQHELVVNERVRQCQLRGDPALPDLLPVLLSRSLPQMLPLFVQLPLRAALLILVNLLFKLPLVSLPFSLLLAVVCALAARVAAGSVDTFATSSTRQPGGRLETS